MKGIATKLLYFILLYVVYGFIKKDFTKAVIDVQKIEEFNSLVKNTKKEESKFVLKNVMFNTEAKAQKALNDLKEFITFYEELTVFNLYNRFGVPCSYVDHLYGWTELGENITIKKTTDGDYFFIDFPEPICLFVED